MVCDGSAERLVADVVGRHVDVVDVSALDTVRRSHRSEVSAVAGRHEVGAASIGALSAWLIYKVLAVPIDDAGGAYSARAGRTSTEIARDGCIARERCQSLPRLPMLVTPNSRNASYGGTCPPWPAQHPDVRAGLEHASRGRVPRVDLSEGAGEAHTHAFRIQALSWVGVGVHEVGVRAGNTGPSQWIDSLARVSGVVAHA